MFSQFFDYTVFYQKMITVPFLMRRKIVFSQINCVSYIQCLLLAETGDKVLVPGDEILIPSIKV